MVFREMRRIAQMLSEEEANSIMMTASSGVLALTGDGGYSYAVPLNFAYENSRIYFHCAKEGHKIDALKNNEKVSFCVIDKDNVIPEAFNTIYRSVIAFGKARILDDDGERMEALERLIRKYSPAYALQGKKEIEKYWDRVCLVEIHVEHMTGKASRDFLSGS